MPQGGGSTSNVSAQSSEEGASRQIFRLMREGVSWSGHERNTCFLSSGAAGRFIDISKASGFDFPDDGRAMVLTDWDGDGDLCLLYTSPSPRDQRGSRMPSSA